MRNILWLLVATGWLLVGTWFVAPLLGLAIAFLLMVGVRGYAQAMVLVWLFAGVARWVFLLVAGCFIFYTTWSVRMTNRTQLLYCIGSSLIVFTMIIFLINLLWFKVIWMSSTEEPFRWLSLELVGALDAASVLRNIALFVSFWRDLHSNIPATFYIYYALKLILNLILIKSLVEKCYANEETEKRWMLAWLVAVLLWLCSLIGLPPSDWKFIEGRVVLWTYEIVWWLATVPISWGCLMLVVTTYRGRR